MNECVVVNQDENDVLIEGHNEHFIFETVFRNGEELYNEEVKPLHENYIL